MEKNVAGQKYFQCSLSSSANRFSERFLPVVFSNGMECVRFCSISLLLLVYAQRRIERSNGRIAGPSISFLVSEQSRPAGVEICWGTYGFEIRE